MPSRKRAKGKERKLKNQARGRIVRSFSTADDDGWGDWGDMSQWEQSIRNMERLECVGCKHGCVIPPLEHPVYKFMNTIEEKCSDPDDQGYFLDAVKKTFENHHEVWKDAEMREMTIKILLNTGTNFILTNMIDSASKMTSAIILLERYTGVGSFSSIIYRTLEDLGYLRGAGDNDVIRFYHKRIPCSCLKKIYSDVRECQDRVSECFGCNQTIKRKTLVVCGGCKFAHYCSKECQISDWPTHKTLCRGINKK